jgi:hypothetical protein
VERWEWVLNTLPIIFLSELDLLHLLYNQQIKTFMKTSALEIGFKVWSIGLGALAFGGISIAIFNLLTGNYCSTASFEF